MARKVKPGAEADALETTTGAAEPGAGNAEGSSTEQVSASVTDGQGDTLAANDDQESAKPPMNSPDHLASPEPSSADTPTRPARYSKANAKERAAARKLNLSALKKQRAGTVAVQIHLVVYHAGTSKDRVLSVLTLIERTTAQIRMGNGSYLAPKTAETMLTVLDNALVKYKEEGDEAKMQAAALREAAQLAAADNGTELGQPLLAAQIDERIHCTDAATVATCESVMGFDHAMLDLEFLQVTTGKRAYSTQIATVRARFITGLQALSKVCVGLLRQTDIARNGDDESAALSDEGATMPVAGA